MYIYNMYIYIHIYIYIYIYHMHRHSSGEEVVHGASEQLLVYEALRYSYTQVFLW